MATPKKQQMFVVEDDKKDPSQPSQDEIEIREKLMKEKERKKTEKEQDNFMKLGRDLEAFYSFLNLSNKHRTQFDELIDRAVKLRKEGG